MYTNALRPGLQVTSQPPHRVQSLSGRSQLVDSGDPLITLCGQVSQLAEVEY